jgi:hypothetical protein
VTYPRHQQPGKSAGFLPIILEPVMPVYSIDYRYKGEARQHRIDLNQPDLSVCDAAMHLLQLHFGDSENSLIMPNADALADEVTEQAGRLGLTDINVTRAAADGPS